MRFRPVHIWLNVVLQPVVRGLDGPVVHVVVQVGNHERHRRQAGEICRELREREVGAERNVREVHPRAVLPDIRGTQREHVAVTTAGVPD